MATALTIARAISHRPPRRKHPKAFLASADGIKLVLPFAPREVTHDGLADTYSTIDRPGRKPLVVRTADGLRSFSFDALLARHDHQQPIEDLIIRLKHIAGVGTLVTVSLSALERGAWRLTAASVTSELRQYGTNAITRATVSLTFLEAVDAVVKVGPVSGGHAAPAPGKGGKPKTADTYYTVRKGDTLFGLAVHFYGDGSKWPTIAKANRILDPRKLAVGSRIRIPPKP